MVKRSFPYGTVELEHPETGTFKVNGQRLKLYIGKGRSGGASASPNGEMKKDLMHRANDVNQ